MELQEIGAYLALLSVAWQSERHGYLQDDESKLRRWARMSESQWAHSRELLLSKFPVVEEGWRANPRLVEEAAKQERFSESQRDKINKRWEAERSRNESGNTGEHTGVSISDTGVIPSVSVSVYKKDKDKEPASPVPLDEFLSAWNDNCGSLSKIVKLTGARAAKLRSRIREGLSADDFRAAVSTCARTPFLTGKNDRNWKVDFDWLVENDTNLTKVREGRYGQVADTPVLQMPLANDALSKLRRNLGGGSAA